MPRAPLPRDWAALIALAVLWGSSFLFIKLALVSFSPASIVAGRVLVAAVVLFALLMASGARRPGSWRDWQPMLVMALIGNLLPFMLIASAQQHIDSALAGVLMAIMPLFVLPLAHYFIPGARLTAGRVAGFVAGFAGVVCIIGPAALADASGNTTLWATLAMLGAALSYAVNSIYARRVGLQDPMLLAAGMLLIAGLFALPFAAADFAALAFAPPAPLAAVALLVLGLCSTGLATVLYFRIIQGPGPTFLSLVNYLVPAWAVLAGAWFLDETLALTSYAGLALILAGIALSEFGPRLRQTLRRRAAARPEPVRMATEDA